jgi:hypothetical protein
MAPPQGKSGSLADGNQHAADYLELPSVRHGLNGYKGTMWDAWQERSLSWLAETKLVPAPK